MAALLPKHLQNCTEICPEDADAYLQHVFQFLVNFSWIYDVKITEFFIRRIWHHIPLEWQGYFTSLDDNGLMKLPLLETQTEAPASLQGFLQEADMLSLPRLPDNDLEPVCIPDTIKRGMTPKKYHEVSHIAATISSVCQTTNCSAVLDVGSGLGYLGNVLSEQYGFKVLGLEGKHDRSHGAKLMTEKKCIPSNKVESMEFQLTDDESCFSELCKILEDRFKCERGAEGESGVCMVGLHCCGSLTPTMLKFMTTSPIIKSLVCVSCCYHSIPVNDEGIHEHFPMSRQVQEFMWGVQRKNPGWRLGMYGLRLAAQETRARWLSQNPEDHAHHVKNVAYRGILEVWSQSSDVIIQKEKRNTAKKKDYSSFSTYIDAALTRTSLKDYSDARHQLMEIHDQLASYFKYIEPFTALQVVMQPVIETLIIIDRVLYLKESHLHATVIPVFDEFISPRNLALVIS